MGLYITRSREPRVEIDEATGAEVEVTVLKERPCPSLATVTAEQLEFTIDEVRGDEGEQYRIVRSQAFSTKGDDGRTYYSQALGVLRERTMPDGRVVLALDPFFPGGKAPAKPSKKRAAKRGKKD
jgi:hypothetical protein